MDFDFLPLNSRLVVFYCKGLFNQYTQSECDFVRYNAGCRALRPKKVRAYYYGTTHQNVISSSLVDWKPFRDFFGSVPVGRTCAYFSAITYDKHVTLTSLVRMWTPQQKVQRVLWFTGFKSVTRVQRRVRIEWSVVTPLLACLKHLSELLQNGSRTRSTMSSIPKGYFPV
ncbi:uncharacterized protein TNCV_1666571 [Trichonephila clavipes]|nr:uncharacterized protein TNCV_1666571 [Trichonephila clavipes]